MDYAYCSKYGKWCSLANTSGYCIITACAYPLQRFPLVKSDIPFDEYHVDSKTEKLNEKS